MPLKYVWKHYKDCGDLVCPIVVCDCCGEEITEAGWVCWHHSTEVDREVRTYYFVHSGPCDKAFERQYGKHLSTVAIGEWLVQLTRQFGLHNDKTGETFFKKAHKIHYKRQDAIFRAWRAGSAAAAHRVALGESSSP